MCEKLTDYTEFKRRIRAFGEAAANSRWKLNRPYYLKLLRQRKEVRHMKEAISKLGKNAAMIIVIFAAVLVLALIQKVAAVTPKQLIIVGTVVVLIEAINSWESVQKARIEQTKAKDP